MPGLPVRKALAGTVAGLALLAAGSDYAQDVTTDVALVKKARVIHAQSLVLDAHADIVIPLTPRIYLAEFAAMACSIGPVSGCQVKPAASCAT